MFKIRTFEKRLCMFIRRHFVTGNKNCSGFSIWCFCPMSRYRAILDFLYRCSPCRAEWFPLIFWLFLLLSFIGSAISFIEFMRAYCCHQAHISVWRDRKFYVITYRLLRRARLLGAFVMVNSWIMLMYGMIIVSPSYMIPWLIVSSAMVIVEIIGCLFDILLGRTSLTFMHIVSIVLPVITVCLARCVKTVFENAIENGLEDSLRIFT